MAQHLRKGSSAFVEGRLQTRSWEGKDGEKKYRTEIVADRVQFGPRSGGSPRAMAQDTPAGLSKPGINYPTDDINPDDIPF